MDKLLYSKNAIVTGASSGIGYAIAKKLISEGAHVIITGRNEASLVKACSELGNIDYMVWDITDFDNCRINIEKASMIFGGPVDILINNAGVLTPNDFNMNYLEITTDEWDYVMDINLKATFFMCQNMAKHMLKNSVRGHIVNIASEMGLRPACVTYGISKWGVIGMTKGLGKMLANRGIVVNGIAPGAITTEMMNWHEGDSIYRESHANKRFGFPDEIANLAAFLCSGLGDNIIGEIITSDGGSSLH